MDESSLPAAPSPPPWLPVQEERLSRIIAAHSEEYKPSFFQKIKNSLPGGNKKLLNIFLSVFLATLVVASSVLGAYYYKTKKVGEGFVAPSPSPTPTFSPSPSLSPVSSPAPLTTSKPTTEPTYIAPSPSPSPSPSAPQQPTSGGCSQYDLVSNTGSVQVTIKPQQGVLVGDQIVELKAESGCNVLVYKSADVDTRIARQGSPTVNFSTVPPGPYQVRARYKDQWTGYQSLTVNSGQQTSIEVWVSGDQPSPSPSPKPKPTCSAPTVSPSTTGDAPFEVSFTPNASAGAAGGISGYEWDFQGDGTWDFGPSPNAPTYTYQNPGTYTAKMRVLATNGEYSDICSTMIIVN